MRLLHLGLDAAKNPPTSLMKTFPRHCTQYLDINTGHPNLNNELIKIAKDYQPEFVFMQIQSENVIHGKALAELRAAGAFIVNFSGDVRKPLPSWYIETGKQIDLTLFTNMNDVNEARKKGINADFCIMGYDPEIYKPDYNVTKDIDIAFFGNDYGNQFPLSKLRRMMVGLLRTTYGNRFKVFGNWAKSDGNLMHSQPEEAKMLNRCKITINLSHFEYVRYSSDRLNRTLGCGVFCLTHLFPEMEKLWLVDGVSCSTWSNFDILVKKINYYLEHENERKKIAANGARKAVDYLTFDRMIEMVLSYYPKKVMA